ncbi:MAG TPA: hypothetical protein VF067_00515 [Sphingomicrobium sp.]
MTAMLGRSSLTALAMIALLSTACGRPATTNNALSPESEYSLGPEMRYMDFRQPTLAWPVPQAAAARGAKFVIARIEDVTNPKRVPLTFAVAFRPSGGQTIELGSFSLYPPDNPGRFIVATQGKVEAKGELLLTLQDPGIEGKEAVRVGVADLALGDEAGPR